MALLHPPTPAPARDSGHPAYDGTSPHGVEPGRQAADLTWLLPGAGRRPAEVGAVIALSALGQLLVGYSLKRQCWDIPQGVVEPGETAAEAAARELLEETGLAVAPGDLLPVTQFSHLTPSFVRPFRNHLYLLPPGLDLSAAHNREPAKCGALSWVSPSQLALPRGLSLRVALALLGL